MIRILDADTNLIAEIDVFDSLEWNRNFYGVGIFNLQLSYNAPYATELQKNRLLMLNNETNKVGIIKQIKYSQSGNEEKLTVTGYELKGILKQRITIPPAGTSHQSFTSAKAETVMKDMVEHNCLNIAGMEFDNLNITTDQSRGTTLTLKTRYKKLADEIEKIGRISELGHIITLNTLTNKWDFEILVTTDKSASVFFSPDFNNLEKQDYINSDINSSNYAIVGGQGQAELRTIIEKGTALLDVEKSVMFVDARDIDDADDLESRADQKLSATQTVISYSCFITNVTFVYEIDWDLGDIVTVKNDKLGINEQLQIQNVTEWYTAGNIRRLNVTFGDKPISLKQYVDNNTDYGID